MCKNNAKTFVGSPGEWIQVDLRKPTRVVAVVTQGRNSPDWNDQWVTSYKISFGNSSNTMQIIQSTRGVDLVSKSELPNNVKIK